MKKILFLFSVVSLVFPTAIFASSEVSVNVSNDTQSSSQTSGSSTTEVIIEVNGEKKTFRANGDEDVEWKSEDGKSSVIINKNAEVTPKSVTPSPKTTIAVATSSAKPTTIEEMVKTELSKTQYNLLEALKKEIQRIQSQLFASIKESLPF